MGSRHPTLAEDLLSLGELADDLLGVCLSRFTLRSSIPHIGASHSNYVWLTSWGPCQVRHLRGMAMRSLYTTPSPQVWSSYRTSCGSFVALISEWFAGLG